MEECLSDRGNNKGEGNSKVAIQCFKHLITLYRYIFSIHVMSLCTWVRCEWDLFMTPDNGVINFQSVQFHNSSTSAMAEQSQNDSLYNQDSYGRR